MEKTIDLIGFGDPYLDLNVNLKKLPETDTSCQMDRYGFSGGGNVPTACVAAARLGLKTALIGCVGDDLFGKIGIADLVYNQVDVSGIRMQRGRRSNFSICVTESAVGGKEFISKPGDFDDIKPEELDEDFLRSASMLHVALITPAAARACDIVRAAGGKVSADANYYRPYTFENYDKIDIFIGSEQYYRCFCEDKGLRPKNYRENMAVLNEYGPETVVFTFGADGCRGLHDGQYFYIPAFKVKVADTTGAGDVFHGAFDFFRLRGYDAEESARYASGVSAIKCTAMGGRTAIPTLPVLQEFIRTGKIDYGEISLRIAHYENAVRLDY